MRGRGSWKEVCFWRSQKRVFEVTSEGRIEMNRRHSASITKKWVWTRPTPTSMMTHASAIHTVTNLRLTALLTFHNPSSHIRMPTGRTANSYLVQVQGKLYTPPLGTYSFLFIYSLIHFKCRLEHIQERKKILIQEYAKSLPNSWGYPCHRMWWWWWWWGKGRTVEFCSHSQK